MATSSRAILFRQIFVISLTLCTILNRSLSCFFDVPKQSSHERIIANLANIWHLHIYKILKTCFPTNSKTTLNTKHDKLNYLLLRRNWEWWTTQQQMFLLKIRTTELWWKRRLGLLPAFHFLATYFFVWWCLWSGRC